MKVSEITSTVVFALFVALAAAASNATAQASFPDTEGRDTVLFACSRCHSLNRITRARLTEEDWEFIVYDMIARGAPVHAEDVAALKEYLQENFAVERQ